MERLLLVTVDYLPHTGGVANYYARLVQHLQPHLAVLTCVPGSEEHGIYRKNFYSSVIWPKWLPLLWLIPKYLKIAKAQGVLVGNLLPIGTAVWLLNYFIKVPYIVSVHGLDVQLAKVSRWKKWLAGKILTKASKVVANSQFTISLLADFNLAKNKINCLYPLCLEPAKSTTAIQGALVKKYNLKQRRVILTVSRLVARKGIARVLEALAEVAKSDHSWVYVIVGEGPEYDKLEQQAKQINLPVIMTGRVSQEELVSWYNLCDCFVLTPLNNQIDIEGFGMVYLEAMGFGKPVVASRVGGVPEAVGEAGLYADTHLELVNVLQRLLSNDNLRQELASKSQQRFNYYLNLQDQTSVIFTIR